MDWPPLFTKNRLLVMPELPVPLSCTTDFFAHEYRSEPDYRWSGLRRGNVAFFIWQHTLDGEGALRVGKTQYRIAAGQSMLVHVPSDHEYWLPKRSDHWEFVVICLFGPASLRVCGQIEKHLGPVFDLPANGRAAPALEAFVHDNLSEASMGDPFEVAARTYPLLLALQYDASRMLAGARPRPDFVDRAVAYCQAHLDENPTVEALASVVDCSVFHFSREFKRYLDVSPGAYVLQLRLQKAERLLQMERLSIGEVAQRCQFASTSAFSRAFSKQFGHPPSEFRHVSERSVVGHRS